MAEPLQPDDLQEVQSSTGLSAGEAVAQTQQATYRIAEAALQSRDTGDLFEKVHGIVRDLMPAECAYIALWDQASDTVSFPYWVDTQDPRPEPRRLRRGLTEYVLHSGKPLLVDGPALTQLQANGEVESFGSLSLHWLGVPLCSQNGVFGILAVQSYQGGHEYTRADRDLLAFVGSQVALAIERTRAQTEQRILLAAMDQAVDPIFGIGVEGSFVFVNRAACTTLGYDQAELLELHVWDVDPDISEAQWPNRWQATLAQGYHRHEATHRRRDGSTFPVEISSSLVASQGREVIFSNVRDISSRRSSDEALRASEVKFSKAFHASPDAINITRLADGTYLDVSEGFTKLTGWTREEVQGRASTSLDIWVDLEDRLRAVALIQQYGEFTSQEFRFRRKDGSVLTGIMSGKVMEMNGEPCLLSITRDISDRKAAVAALEAERGLFVGGPVMMVRWVATSEGWPTNYVSPNVEALLGFTPEDLTSGRVSFHALVHPDDLERTRGEAQALRAKGIERYEQQYRLRNAAGEYRWFHDFTVPGEVSPEGPTYLGYMLDITERRQAEDALRQAQKLESLGILAGGIAHDFNNLLTIIMGNLNLAQLQLPDPSPAQRYLANLEATVLRATELTKQMLAYSGRGHFIVKPQDLNQAVQEVTHLLKVSIPKKIVLNLDLEPGLPAVQADAAQIQQVVMNLVTKAADAIGSKVGAIHLSTTLATLDEEELRTWYRGQNLLPGRYVLLEIVDTGCGMSPDILARIFDPFFTTKTKGRGLGLSAMLGILRGHGAGLHIQSEPLRGSAFRICFPATDHPAPQDSRTAVAPSSHALKGRVLLVDDEELILQTIGAALQSMGLEVTTAADGLEAVTLFKEALPRPDLVLMDLTMPRMDGREAFQAIHDLDPGVPVVLSSGFSEQDSLRTLSGHGPAAFMQKPYRIKELRELLQRLLEKGPSSS